MNRLLAGILAFALSAPCALEAQVRVGASGTYHTQLDALGVSARTILPTSILGGRPFVGGALGTYFSDRATIVEVEGSLAFRYPVSRLAFLFGFVGTSGRFMRVEVANGSVTDFDPGIDLGVGWMIDLSGISPFLSTKAVLQDELVHFVMSAGVMFYVGG